MLIPEKVVNFNVYDKGEKLVGLSSEVTLPNLENMTETVSGAGIMGEYDSPTIGHFGAISVDITFRTIYEKNFSLLDPRGKTLILRGSQQFNDSNKGLINRALKITMRGFPKGIDLGKMGIGTPTDTKIPLELTYIKIEEDNKILLEVDKINFIYIINGEDIMKELKNQI